MPHRLRPSRLLLRLEAEIAAAPSVLAADCKRAERAVYLARLARFDDAHAAVADLQQHHARQPQIETSIWLNFAQGVIAYYENVGVCRTDYVRRAHAIATAAGHLPLRALCAAWLSLWDYARLDMVSVARHVREAVAMAQPGDHATLARAGLVAAQALHTAGRPDLARRWYQSSRHHATVDGDDATISALMHNMSWAGLLLLRQAVLTGAAVDGLAPDVAINLQSSDQFDELLGGSLWQDMRPLLKAQVLSLQHDVAGALALYEAHSTSEMLPRLEGMLLADKAWCLMALGRSVEARACAELAIQRLSNDTQVDDSAAAHSRLAQVYAGLGETLLAQSHEALARQAWQAHATAQALTIELLDGLAPAGPPG